MDDYRDAQAEIDHLLTQRDGARAEVARLREELTAARRAVKAWEVVQAREWIPAPVLQLDAEVIWRVYGRFGDRVNANVEASDPITAVLAADEQLQRREGTNG